MRKRVFPDFKNLLPESSSLHSDFYRYILLPPSVPPAEIRRIRRAPAIETRPWRQGNASGEKRPSGRESGIPRSSSYGIYDVKTDAFEFGKAGIISRKAISGGREMNT
jgi:hypothetical protein